MSSPRAMAALTRNSRHGMRRIEVIAYVRRRRVTTETGRSFVRWNFASQRTFQRIGNTRRVVGRYGNAQVAKKTYAGLFETTLMFKQKTLSAAAAAEYPEYRRRKCLAVSGDRIGHRLILLGQAVMEWANVIDRFSTRKLGFRGRNRRVRHGVLLLAGG